MAIAAPPSTGTKVMTYAEALNEALREEMRRDPTVFVMGEDVAVWGGGGVFGVTLGMNPLSSSAGMRTLTGGALPLGSESNTIGSTITAASTSAMAPTSRRRPRRFSVLTSSDSAIGVGDRQEGAEHDDLIILASGAQRRCQPLTATRGRTAWARLRRIGP